MDLKVIRLINPSREEMEEIIEEFDLVEDFILDPLDEDERARIEEDNGKILIILKVPLKTSEERLPYRTTSLGVILLPDSVLIVSKREVPFLDNALKNGRLSFEKRNESIFHVFHMNATEFLRYLRDIHSRITSIEEELHRSLRNKEIEEMMNLEKSLVYFVTALKSNEIVMERIGRGKILEFREEEEDILEDAIVDNRQALDVANIYSDILAGMMDAYASIISNNLNIVMKILAIMTIILEIPTVITSFYGMNVALPFQKNPLAYLHIIIWSVVSILLILFWFRKKRWL